MKRNPLKLIWLSIGCLCLGLGTIGVVLPILPTVPFYMATVVCFAKSSKRMHSRFVSGRLYKRHLESFVTEKSMSLKTKLSVMGTVTAVMAIGFILMQEVPAGRICLAVVWLFHVIYFMFRIRTLKENPGQDVEGSSV